MAGKHTSGPWELKRNFTKYEIHSDNDIVAYVSPTMLPEDAENLRLMAAAPDYAAWAESILARGTHRGTLLLEIEDVIALQAIHARATQPLPPPNEENES